MLVLGTGLVAIFNAPRAAQIKDELARTDDDLPFDAEARARLLGS